MHFLSGLPTLHHFSQNHPGCCGKRWPLVGNRLFWPAGVRLTFLLTEWKNSCGCKCIAVPVRKLILLRFYVNQNFSCASFYVNCWIIMSEWDMLRTKTKTAFLCSNFYNTLDNKWKNNARAEKCPKIHRTPSSLKIDFWNIITLKHRS